MTLITLNDIDIQVTKKKIKNLNIRINGDGEVKISAPNRTPDKVILDFAQSRFEWIKTNRDKILSRKAIEERSFFSGETHYLWGKPYELELLSSEKAQAQVCNDKIMLCCPENYTAAQREEVLNELYRFEIKKLIPDLLEPCEKIVGATANEWGVKNMRTRWGSCNTAKARIWLNLQLAKKPLECLEYVIIHELTHLYEANHSQRFWSLMDRFYPQWRQVRAALNTTDILPED